MDDLLIKRTSATPEIEFKTSGQMLIKGKSLPEDPRKFYNPIFDWIKDFSANKVQIDVKLEYVNTSSSKNIIELIKLVDKNENIKYLNLNWYYEIDDIEMLEFGEVIGRSIKRAKTEFIECDDIDA